MRKGVGSRHRKTALVTASTTPSTPTTGPRERGKDTSGSTGRSGRQKAATRRSTRREERVTVQGPVKKQQCDGISQREGHLNLRSQYLPDCSQPPDLTCRTRAADGCAVPAGHVWPSGVCLVLVSAFGNRWVIVGAERQGLYPSVVYPIQPPCHKSQRFIGPAAFAASISLSCTILEPCPKLHPRNWSSCANPLRKRRPEAGCIRSHPPPSLTAGPDHYRGLPLCTYGQGRRRAFGAVWKRRGTQPTVMYQYQIIGPSF